MEPVQKTGAEGYWGGKLCECSDCKTVERCTPRNDFYTRDKERQGPLVCEGCLLKVT